MATPTAKGIRRVSTTDPMVGPTNITDLANDIDSLIDETVATVAGLPSTGNWTGRTMWCQEDLSYRVWSGSAWIIIYEKMKREQETTNTPIFYRMQSGFGKITGDASDDISETVTFHTAFADLPNVQVSYMGYRATGAYNITGLTTGEPLVGAAQAVSSTTFLACLMSSAATALGTGFDWYYQWVAIGEM